MDALSHYTQAELESYFEGTTVPQTDEDVFVLISELNGSSEDREFFKEQIYLPICKMGFNPGEALRNAGDVAGMVILLGNLAEALKMLE